ncbi:hypothetical protein NVP1198B_13 [Vibrio phage 1.198.B._10N.286.54.F4]|nr:hypothetical protein NVP1198A_13 [Vibrio phage 1.198.A._10N.286.54.F4]AUR94801.1 hypothetical protein NVP1198B_13 [Vibrio phage 1.198.B._10N.286.54.F4]
MNDDITEGIKIPNGVFVELIIEDEIVYMLDADSGEIYEVWRVH